MQIGCFRKYGQKLANNQIDLVAVAKIAEYDCELITPQPCCRITFANALLDTPRYFEQNLISVLMSVEIINFLEAVQINEK